MGEDGRHSYKEIESYPTNHLYETECNRKKPYLNLNTK